MHAVDLYEIADFVSQWQLSIGNFERFTLIQRLELNLDLKEDEHWHFAWLCLEKAVSMFQPYFCRVW